jgi:uncharacterized repeat protein (TIGR03803 family)
MQRNKFWTALTAALIMALILAPGAWAGRYKVLHAFTYGLDGGEVHGALVFDGVGNLYGTAYWGGDYGCGVVFKLTPNPDGSWTQSVLHSFSGGQDGCNAHSALIFDTAGNLYGNAGESGAYGCGVIFKLAPNPDGNWTESVIHSFTGNDGCHSWGGLTSDAAGNLYGMTEQGGAHGLGVVFKLTLNPDESWSESVLHSFRGGKGGAYPARQANVAVDVAGNLYGTTRLGGTDDHGLVFKLASNPDGTWEQTVLHRFRRFAGGTNPFGGVAVDAAGSLYGTTASGGKGTDVCPAGLFNPGCGVLYKLTPKPDGTWTKTVLHRFKGGKDGANPFARPIFDKAGNLFGTAPDGAGNCGGVGCGMVYKLTPDPDGSWTKTTQHRFRPESGTTPTAGVIMDEAGNLYGGTAYNGPGGGGVVYEITP